MPQTLISKFAKLCIRETFQMAGSKIFIKEGTNTYSLTEIDADLKHMINDGSTLTMTITLKRSWVLIYLIPLILFFSAIIAGYISSKPDTGFWKVVAAFFSISILTGVYKYVIDKYYSDIPDMLELNGSLNYLDCFYIICFIIFLLAAYLFHKKK